MALVAAWRSLVGSGQNAAPSMLLLLRHSSNVGSPSTSRMFVWGDILRAARSDPERLHDIVDTLSKHCVAVQAAPPLDSFNDLISICDAHGDLSSIHKLCHMASAVSMHLDATTNARLAALWPRYLPTQLSPEDSFMPGSSSRGGIGIAPPSRTGDDSSPPFSVSGGSGSSNGRAPAGISWSISGRQARVASTPPPPQQQQQQQQQPQGQGQPLGSSSSSRSSSSAGVHHPVASAVSPDGPGGRYGQGGHGGHSMRD